MTNLSTLVSDGELVQLAQGPCGTVAAVAGWRESVRALTPGGDVDRALQKALTLAHTPLDIAIRAKWCSRLRGRSDMFEVRINGIRFYGGRVTTAGQLPALVLLFAGAEQKAGSKEADPAVLERAESKLAEIRDRLAREPGPALSLVGRAASRKAKEAR